MKYYNEIIILDDLILFFLWSRLQMKQKLNQIKEKMLTRCLYGIFIIIKYQVKECITTDNLKKKK